MKKYLITLLYSYKKYNAAIKEFECDNEKDCFDQIHKYLNETFGIKKNNDGLYYEDEKIAELDSQKIKFDQKEIELFIADTSNWGPPTTMEEFMKK
ncbi:MAG: hypothetical protein ABI855_05740 [Bacteroidota bacterium]